MNAKKLFLTSVVGTVLMFVAGTQFASANPVRRPVARPYHGGNWNRPYRYNGGPYVYGINPYYGYYGYPYGYSAYYGYPYYGTGISVGVPGIGLGIGFRR